PLSCNPCRYAATPATCGAAREVPDTTSLPPSRSTVLISSPGARMLTHLPQLDQGAKRFLRLVLATVHTLGSDPGDSSHASAWAFPAPVTTNIPRLVREAAARSTFSA